MRRTLQVAGWLVGTFVAVVSAHYFYAFATGTRFTAAQWAAAGAWVAAVGTTGSVIVAVSYYVYDRQVQARAQARSVKLVRTPRNTKANEKSPVFKSAIQFTLYNDSEHPISDVRLQIYRVPFKRYVLDRVDSNDALDIANRFRAWTECPVVDETIDEWWFPGRRLRAGESITYDVSERFHISPYETPEDALQVQLQFSDVTARRWVIEPNKTVPTWIEELSENLHRKLSTVPRRIKRLGQQNLRQREKLIDHFIDSLGTDERAEVLREPLADFGKRARDHP